MRLRITLYENQSRWRDAVSRAAARASPCSACRFPNEHADTQAALDREVDTIERLLGGRLIASLVDLPVMTDRRSADGRCAFSRSSGRRRTLPATQLLARLISATMVRLSMEHGNTEDSRVRLRDPRHHRRPDPPRLRVGVRMGRRWRWR